MKWKALHVGLWKINTDEPFHQSDRGGSACFVVRDFSGNMVARGAFPLRGQFSAEHVELLACCKAVDFSITQGFFPLILETDAHMVQRQLGAVGSPNTFHLGRIYEDLWRKLELAGSWKICYTRRDSNVAAHSMAAYASTLEQEVFFFSVPRFIQSVLTAEA